MAQTVDLTKDLWRSRRITNVGGLDGAVLVEERIYEVPDDDVQYWWTLTGEKHPWIDNLYVTRVDVDRHARGENAEVRVTFSSSGVLYEYFRLGKYQASARSSVTRDVRELVCPKGGETATFDLYRPRTAIRLLGWEKEPNTDLINLMGCINDDPVHFVFLDALPWQLMTTAVDVRQVGHDRWRHEVEIVYNVGPKHDANYTAPGWMRICPEHSVPLKNYPAVHFDFLEQLIVGVG